MKKIINTLRKELRERDTEYKNTVSYKDAIFITISLGIALFTVLEDTQIYFYRNFWIYSAGLFVFLCILSYFFVLKTFKVHMLSFISVFILNISLSMWIIPKIVHYAMIPDQTICYKGILKDKYWHRSGNKGYIKIDPETDQSILVRSDIFSSWRGVFTEEYDQLPPIGSKIQICGELSSVGFSYAYIDTL